MMLISQALKKLVPPLIFGNPEQIEAIQSIERHQQCVEALRQCRELGHEDRIDCDECDGEGTCYHCGHACDECDGTGKQKRDRGCCCLDFYTGDEVHDAESALDKEKPRKQNPTLPLVVRR